MKPWWFFVGAIAAGLLATIDMMRDAGAPGLPEDPPAAEAPANQ